MWPFILSGTVLTSFEVLELFVFLFVHERCGDCVCLKWVWFEYLLLRKGGSVNQDDKCWKGGGQHGEKVGNMCPVLWLHICKFQSCIFSSVHVNARIEEKKMKKKWKKGMERNKTAVGRCWLLSILWLYVHVVILGTWYCQCLNLKPSKLYKVAGLLNCCVF